MPKENNMSKKDEVKKKELSDKIAGAIKLSELQGKNMTEFKKFGLEEEAKAKMQELKDKKVQLKEEADKAIEKAEKTGGPEARQELSHKIEPIAQEAKKTVGDAEIAITAVVAEVGNTEELATPPVKAVVEKKNTPKTKPTEKGNKHKTNKKENNIYKPQTPEERIEKIRKEGSEEAKKVVAEWDAEKKDLTSKLVKEIDRLDGKPQKEYARHFSFKDGDINFDDPKDIKISIQKALDSIGLPVKSIQVPEDDFVATITLNDGTVMEFGDITEEDELEPKLLSTLVKEIINHCVDTDENTLLGNLRIVGAIDSRYAKKLGDLEDKGTLYIQKTVEPKSVVKEPVKKIEPVVKKADPIVETKIRPESDPKIQAILESMPEYADILEYYNNPALADDKVVQAEKKMLLEQPMIYFLNQMLKKDESGKGYYYSREARAKFQKVYGELVRLKTGQVEKTASPISTIEPVLTTVVEEKKENTTEIEKLHAELQPLFADEAFGDAQTVGREFPPEVKAQFEKMGGTAPEEEEAPTPTLFPGDPDDTTESVTAEDTTTTTTITFTPPPAPTVATGPTHTGPTLRTVDSLNFTLDEIKTLREKLGAFNITLEDAINSIEGFDGLSYGQQRMVLENLGQITLGRIEDAGFKNRQDDMRNSKWNKQIWKMVSNKYQLVTKTKESADQIMAGGLPIHGELLQQLVKGVQTLNLDVEVIEEGTKKNKVERLETAFASSNGRMLSDAEKKLIRSFNSEANLFARIPHEWSFNTATKKQQKEYKAQEALFEQALSNMVFLKKKELGNSIDVEEQAVSYGIELRNKVHMVQFLGNYPDFEEKLSELRDPSELAKLGDIVSADKGISFVVGAATRSCAAITLGIGALPAAMLAGSVTGTIGGIRTHNRNVIAQEKAARRATSTEAQAIKKSLKDRGLEDVTLREATLAMTIDGYTQTERLKKILQDIENLDAQSGSLERREYHKKRFLLIQSLRRREMYIRAKSAEGTINFGSDAERVENHLAFTTQLTQAQIYLAINEKNPADDILLELYTEKENRSNVRKERFNETIKQREAEIEILEKQPNSSSEDKKTIGHYKRNIAELIAERDNLVLPGIGEKITKGLKSLKSYLPQWIVGRPAESTYTTGALTDQDKINLAKNPSQRAELLADIQKRNSEKYKLVKDDAWRAEVGKAALMGAGFGMLGSMARYAGEWAWDAGSHTIDTIKHFANIGSSDDIIPPVEDGGVVETDPNPGETDNTPPETEETTPQESEAEEPKIEENTDETTTDETKTEEMAPEKTEESIPKETETTPTETTSELTEEAKIAKGEGIEHAFRRQIEANTDIATKLGWNGTQDIHEFSGGAAHRLAEDLGYVGAEGEIRVGTEGVGYQLSLDGDEVGVSEYDTDGNVVESHTSADDFEGTDNEGYEYQTKSEGTTTESVETEKTVEGVETGKEAAEAATETKGVEDLVTKKEFIVNIPSYDGTVNFTYDESGNVLDVITNGKLLTDPEQYLNENWLDSFGYAAPGAVDPKMEDLLARIETLAIREELLKSLISQKGFGDEIAFLQQEIATLNTSIESEYGDIVKDSAFSQVTETTPASTPVVPEAEPTQKIPEVSVAEVLTPEQMFEQKVTDATNTLLSRFFVEEGVLLTEAKYGPETSIWNELSSVDAGSFFAENTEGTINPEYVEFAESLQRISEDTGIALSPTEGQTMDSFLHDFIAQTLESSR